ncbi:winged helix-turn-helix transcriptional regulator [Patulibacter defluvii]|uniref:winged helix-turn-helix transcriptional regulator n=1 Tax=Patulibacter defluvii TaxID=3095358 RepID=UPI002A751365|nr:helix-turn-helix domain-containing protein [Patulibacter sp. DM4]
MLPNRYETQACAAARALEIVGERWTLLIVRDAFFGVRRFSDFAVHLDVPRAVLSERLRSLVQDGVLAREPDPEHPSRHHYRLTAAGRDLWPVLHALVTWGGTHRVDGPTSRRFTHAACGSELGPHARCPACDLTPEPEEVLTAARPGVRPLRDDPVTQALQPPRRLLTPL